jgi:hypothetical protein
MKIQLSSVYLIREIIMVDIGTGTKKISPCKGLYRRKERAMREI